MFKKRKHLKNLTAIQRKKEISFQNCKNNNRIKGKSKISLKNLNLKLRAKLLKIESLYKGKVNLTPSGLFFQELRVQITKLSPYRKYKPNFSYDQLDFYSYASLEIIIINKLKIFCLYL